MLLPAIPSITRPVGARAGRTSSQPNIYQYRCRHRYGRVAVPGGPSYSNHRFARSWAGGVLRVPAGLPFEPTLS